MVKTAYFCLFSAVQKPEKLSSLCAAGALRDGVCAYTALHTHARMAAGHTLLVMDGSSVRIVSLRMNCVVGAVWFSNGLISCNCEAFRPHVRPAGLLPRSQGSHHVTLAAETGLPGAASAQRRFVSPTALTTAPPVVVNC